MKYVVLLLTLALMASAETFVGVVTDSMCAASHEAMKMGSDADCVKACVKGHNSKYSLHTGKNVYKLSDQSAPAAFAGKKVKVNGTLYEKTGIIKVESIAAAK